MTLRSAEQRHAEYLRRRDSGKVIYAARREEIRAAFKARYDSDPSFREAVKTRSLASYRKRHPGARSRAEISPDGPLEKREYNRRAAAKATNLLFAALGSRCACCGITDRAFLTLDHIQGDGAAHRRAVSKGRGGAKMYSKILADGVDQARFRLLCMNCNWATRYGKRCPHEVERELAI